MTDLNEALRQSIETLESALGDPRQGLPHEVFLFLSRICPLVNVDLLVQDERGRTLLTWREDEHFGAGWHLPGGNIRFKESAVDRVRACARQELHAEVSVETPAMFISETIREPSNRGHLVSLLFRCHLLTALDDGRRAAADRPLPGQWQWHAGCPADLLDVHAHYARFM